ncbi:condensation domain-containing protein, partial [Streptomyces sp. NPDC006798]|uniref:condensation domain-containing protein n=1 Tax=Streptomyces sp. NPDC006798 TaxID=3155462 RepID=UPI0033F4D424
GLRIEPAEIETTLTTHPHLTHTTIQLREDTPGVQHLVAYVVPADGATPPDDAELRAWAAARLPEYMVPSAFVTLTELPLTPNGKLDRRALPAPRFTDRETGRAPRDAREEIAVGVFADALGLRSVGADDDFFVLGGHSLLAARVAGRLREALGGDCAVRDVFELRTPARLAEGLAPRSAPEGGPTAPALTAFPARRAARPPLSYAQHRLWLLDAVRGTGTVYNVPLAVRLRGPVDAEALRAAVGDVVARHEVLRTVIAEYEGEPYQRILPADGAGVPFEVREVAAGRLRAEAESAGGHAFDLAREIPVRVTLLRSAPDDAVLLVLIHHIATDEASAAPLLADLSRAYAARTAGGAPEFGPLPVQYADYALWQRETLGEPDDPDSRAAAETAYWRDALAGLPAEIALPADRPRPAEPTFRGGVVPFTVPAETADGLLRLARGSGATPFMVAHAAVAALLHRLGAGDDVPLGSPVSGRPGPEVDELVGFFLNTLVLRADLSGNPSFAELVERVRDTALAGFAHAELPLEAVVAAVDHERSRSRNPLFQTMVTYHSAEESAGELFGVAAEEFWVETGGAKLDLELAFGTLLPGTEVEGGIRYAADRFDAPTVAVLAERLIRLLTAVAADPNVRLSQITLLDDAERDRILHGFNDTTVALDGPTTLADLVTAGAEGAQGPALVFEGTETSRTDFESAVNRLTRLLIGRGAGPETVVAVALPRSPELLIALHAVVRAGAAYLPLDLTLPAERLGYLLEAGGPALVLTDAVGAAELPEVSGVPRIVLGSDRTAAETAVLPDGPVTDADRTAPLLPRHPAYLIFTSGSTGRPKGVLVEHRAIVNRLQWMQHAYDLTATDRVLQKTPTSFDVSVWELFWPLTQGIPLVIARPEGHKEPDYLNALIRDEAVSVCHFVPSMLGAYLTDHTVDSTPSLRLVVCSGEALTTDLVDRFHDHNGHSAVLANLYGPTEAAVDVTAAPATAGLLSPTAPIGTPV